MSNKYYVISYSSSDLDEPGIFILTKCKKDAKLINTLLLRNCSSDEVVQGSYDQKIDIHSQYFNMLIYGYKIDKKFIVFDNELSNRLSDVMTQNTYYFINNMSYIQNVVMEREWIMEDRIFIPIP